MKKIPINRFQLILSSLLFFALAAPATANQRGLWNGFLAQQNVVECSNLLNQKLPTTFRLYSSTGGLLATSELSFLPRETKHLLLTNSEIVDAYGSYELSAAVDKLSCQTLFYRQATQTQGEIAYAFSLQTNLESNGMKSGIFNSMNPSLAPTPVQNWLSILNSSTQPFTATIELYDVRGVPLAEPLRMAQLEPGARRDIPLGHDRGQLLGLYRIIPEDASASYVAFLTRYSGSIATDFDFAFPLYPQAGSCESSSLPISTMAGASNWIELANPSETEATLAVAIQDTSGRSLLSEPLEITIAPYSQFHIRANDYIPTDAIGTVFLQCEQSDEDVRIIPQSLFYGPSDPGRATPRWAYASQVRDTPLEVGDKFSIPLNTFLRAANWTKLLSSSEPANFSLQSFSAAGQLTAQTNLALEPQATRDRGLHELLGPQAIGFTLGTLQNGSTPAPESIRVLMREDGTVGYIFNVPPYVLRQNDSNENSGGGQGSQELAPSEPRSSISKDGITWTFDREYITGRFVTGDWWVLGPVTVTSITRPAGTPGRDGSMVNPLPSLVTHGYDARVGDYRAELNVALSLPRLELAPGASLVSTISRNPNELERANRRPALEVAAVLTVLDEIPARNSFRPPYSGQEKPIYSSGRMNTDLLLQLPLPASAPTLQWAADTVAKPWIDHVYGWQGDDLHPDQNLNNYGGGISRNVNDVALRLLIEGSLEDKLPAIIGLTQIGIDNYALVRTGANWGDVGGTIGVGRKLPILFAGLMLGERSLRRVAFDYDTRRVFQEDGQTFYLTQSERDGTLHPANCSGSSSFCHPGFYDALSDGTPAWGERHRRWQSGNYNYLPGKMVYQGITHHSTLGAALFVRLLGLEALWNYDAFLDWTDRSRSEGLSGSWGSQFSRDMWNSYR